MLDESLNQLKSDIRTEIDTPIQVLNSQLQRTQELILDVFELSIKISKNEMNLEDILKIGNMEIRRIALKSFGIENLINSSDAKLVSKSKRGNELYILECIPGYQATGAYFLKYKCASTDRIYFSGIDPEVIEEGKKMLGTCLADYAMAWKFQWSIKEYNKLKIES